MSSNTALEISDLTVKLGRNEILRDLSVTMPKGAIGLLGPNGAGKSTLLKTLMGFLPVQDGSLKVFGYNPVTNGAQVRQLIGYMPEDDTYIPGMTAVEFVSYCGLLCGLPHKESMLRAHLALHYCGLGEARYRPVDTYSTGMRQRIILAQALIHDPDLLFLDEPTNGLDPQGRKQMLELIKDVAHNKGISVILSSHLLPDVEFVCDYVMVLYKGKLATSGRIQDLKRLAQTAYEVRVKGDQEEFSTAISRLGGRCDSKRNGLVCVQLPEGQEKPELIFEAARQSGVQVRHLTREEMTLQEIFSSAIEQV